MSKKSQRVQQNHNVVAVAVKYQPVEIKTIDELALFSEEELRQRFVTLSDELNNKRYAPGSAQAAPWEIELAYVQREMEINQQRKANHRDYLNKNRESFRSYDSIDENLLPEYQGNTPPPNWS